MNERRSNRHWLIVKSCLIMMFGVIGVTLFGIFTGHHQELQASSSILIAVISVCSLVLSAYMVKGSRETIKSMEKSDE